MSVFKKSRFFVLWIALLALGLAIGACGDDDDDDSSGGADDDDITDDDDNDTADDDDTSDDDDDDATGPEVASTVPVAGQNRLKLATTVSVTFSEKMDGTSVEEAFSMAGVTGTFVWNGAGDTVTFTPDDLLDDGTTYTVIIDTGATNNAGEPLGSSYNFSFTTIPLWTKVVNGSSNDNENGYSIALDGENNVYAVGDQVASKASTDMLFLIYDLEGSKQWEGSYNGSGDDSDYARAVAAEDDGAFYITGYTLTSTEGINAWVRKYLAGPTADWTDEYNGAANDRDYGNAIALDGLGYMYVAGSTFVTGQEEDIWIQKYDTDGGIAWTRTFDGGNNANDRGFGVAAYSDGAYVTGFLGDAVYGGQVFVRKYDSDGNEEWTEIYNGSSGGNADQGNDIAADADDNAYVAGYIINSSTETMAWARKYDSEGSEVWTATKTGTGTTVNSANGIAVDETQNVYVTGNLQASFGSDIFVMKLDPDGNEIWSNTASGNEEGGHKGQHIAVDDQGNSYVIGRVYNGASSGFDLWIRVYDTDGNFVE